MACSTFSTRAAHDLLRGKFICFLGDSNTRALYKDLLWLLEDGRIIPEQRLKTKNELSHANDTRLSSGELHNGCNYEEIREYNESTHIKFQFITRLYLPAFIDAVRRFRTKPDIVAINSCVWDLTRWGSNGITQFKENLYKTLAFLKDNLPSAHIVWITSMPPAFSCYGGFLTPEIEFLRSMLPWHIVFANKYASDVATSLQIDVLDLHYHFNFLGYDHAKDGIHWMPKSVRYATNMFLTHVALVWRPKLLGNPLDKTAVERSQIVRYGKVQPKAKFWANLWDNTDMSSSEINKNISRQLTSYVKFKLPNSAPSNLNKHRQPWKNVVTNCNFYPKFQNKNQGREFRNVQNSGRISKPYCKKPDQQLRKHVQHMRNSFNLRM